MLVAASGEPLRLRGNDMQIFARQQQTIAERLVALPRWFTEGLGLDPSGRISAAAYLLNARKLAQARGTAGEDLRLEPTKKGAAGLALSDRDRLATLLDPLRVSEERNAASGWYFDEDAPFRFFPQRISVELPKGRYDVRSALTEALLSLPADRFTPRNPLLVYHARERNPFVVSKGGRRTVPQIGYGSRRIARREEWEALWGDLLDGFLVMRLVLLGGARVGRTAAGDICFALTDAGRYLLGAADDFRYGHDLQADVIVQPNFEIVFLAPAPKVEAQLARFAERIGAGPGVMFRLTRGSLLAAAEAGLTLEGVLDTLRTVSSRELPGNVERQIQDWFALVRRVAVRPTVLIRCPDAETVLKVKTAGGTNVRPLTDTVLEMADSTAKARKSLLARLRKDGVFVSQ